MLGTCTNPLVYFFGALSAGIPLSWLLMWRAH